ncbi:zinc ribbon domain-containing protein [Deltaproteobacteria bacterium]|nr:zinc ribbon domain-containing protein [Deltaproteobacteria bacterium]
MATYGYRCDTCEIEFDIRKSMSEYKTPEACPQCEGETRKLIQAVGVIFKGDSWASKNGRVASQMRDSRRKAGIRQEERVRDGAIPGGQLVPNVGGERVENWTEASKLAKSQGKSTAGYDAQAAKVKSKTKKITPT